MFDRSIAANLNATLASTASTYKSAPPIVFGRVVPTGVEKSEAMNVRASTSPFSPNIADTLGNVIIFTAAGDPVFFKELWDQNQGIAVVALLSFRHFGCPSWELASALKEAKPKFDAAGVKLVAIDVGLPQSIKKLLLSS